MSGVEVAGIVLAVMPLFISAWEDYQEGLEPAKAFFQWERQLPEYIRSLRDAAALYEMNIEALIAPITTDAELEQMTDKSYSILWQDAAMQKRIVQRLGKASTAFESNMQQFEKICKDIADCLDLDRTAAKSTITQNKLDVLLQAGSQSPGAAKFELRRRAKFGWSKKRIKNLLTKVQDCNSTMYKITDMARHIEPHRTKKKPPLTQHLHEIQSHAYRLSRALSKAWSCTKHHSHLVGIQLERRLAGLLDNKPMRAKSAPCYSCMLFSVAFSACDTHPHPTTGMFYELEIAVREEPDQNFNAKMTAMTINTSPQVKFSLMDDDDENGSNAPDIDVEPLDMVKNMCSTIHVNHKSPRIGFYLGESHDDLRGVYPVLRSHATCFSGDAELVLLRELLPLRHRRLAPHGLTVRQRVLLASTLSSSLLQLYSTAWLAQGWSNQRVLFLRSTREQFPDAIDVERPLLVHNFSPTSPQLPQLERKQSTKQSVLQSKMALLSLGILLLELYCGETLEERFSEDELQLKGIDDGMQSLALAKNWLDEQVENLSLARQSAISFCLESFIGIKTDLYEATFRIIVHERVIGPLQEEAKTFVTPTKT